MVNIVGRRRSAPASIAEGDESKATMRIDQSLPPESLVPFECHRLHTARVGFINPNLPPHENLLERYAFAVRTEANASAFGQETKVFFGERYGGNGIGLNGGGARCGFDDDYHIKGIGVNPLVSGTTDTWHSNGAESLVAGFVDALWGEALHRILPHGAVRVAAILTTGLTCPIRVAPWHGREGTFSNTPRALVVRESALRPGHFQRAYHYRPTAQAAREYVHDTIRTRHAIQVLPDCLPRARQVDEASWAKLPCIERLNLGLHEMTVRFAEQFAAALSNRVVHAGLCASNICLDGRWIDFLTSGMLSGHSNVRYCSNDSGGMWSQHQRVHEILTDQCYYIQKYWDDPSAAPQATELYDKLNETFEGIFRSNLLYRFALLGGYPEPLIAPVSKTHDVLRFGAHLLKLAFFWNEREFFLTTALPKRVRHRYPSPPPGNRIRAPGYPLGAILLALAGDDSPAARENRLRPLIENVSIRAETIRLHRAFVETVEAQEASARGRSALRRRAVVGLAAAGKTLRFFRDYRLVPFLMRASIYYRSAEHFCSAFERVFRTVSDELAVLYPKDDARDPLVWRSHGVDVRLDTDQGEWHIFENGHLSGRCPIQGADDDSMMSSPALEAARKWWGRNEWSALCRALRTCDSQTTVEAA